TYTAGMVLIMACVCVPVQGSLDMVKLEESWKDCQDILGQMTSHSAIAKRSLKLLQSLHSRVCSKDTARKASSSKPSSPTTKGTTTAISKDFTGVASIVNTEDYPGKTESPLPSEIGDTLVSTTINAVDERGKGLGPSPNAIDGAWWNGPTFDLFLEGSPNELDPGL
ncbi:hypothetical protein GP486_008703, partial [Trichoglossum hirsutum]